MPIYTKTTAEVAEILRTTMQKFHKPLVDQSVKVSTLFACAKVDENGEPKDIPIKLGGYRCAAVIKITSLKERVLGLADALMTIDGDRWEEWSIGEKRAIIDHELEHLALKEDRNGDVMVDDHKRPRLVIRLHDFQIGGFGSIARRHGESALEVQAVRALRVHEAFEQMVLEFPE